MTEDDFSLRDATLAIVGLGLMGGSLALALYERNACKKILAVDQNATTCGQVRARGIDARPNLDAITPADVIVLATPVRTIIDLLPRVGAMAKPNAIVMDLGSTKRDITQAMNTLPAGVQVIGTHPMCGKETAGFGAADPNLFRDAVFVLTPLARTADETMAFAQSLAQTLGARPLIIDAERHDKIVATISHLPYVLASTLMLIANERAHDDDWLFALAASGFRDTSRLAASDTTMMLDILMTNRGNIVDLLRECAQRTNQLANLLERGDEKMLRDILESAAAKRRTLFNQQSKIENRKLL